MKKSIIALFAAAAMSAGVSAQSDTGGANAGTGLNALGGATIATGAVTVGVLSAMVSNNRKEGEVEPGPGPGPGPEEECSGTDPLVDGVCVGTTTTVTNTVTVSGTQTITVPITVPVTFTYAPE